MIRWPGRVKPAQHDTLVSSLDIAPTILSVCGIPKTAAMSGVDLLPICAGQPVQRDGVFGELYAHDIADIDDPSKSLVYRWGVVGKWKLIRHYPGKLGRYERMLSPHEDYPQLYDITADPHEKRNLAGEQPAVLERLSKRIDTIWKP